MLATNRFPVIALLTLLSGNVFASGVFNGATSHLRVDDPLVGTTPDRVVLICCWVKLSAINNFETFFCVSDNSTQAELILRKLGSTAPNNALQCVERAGGSAVAATSVHSVVENTTTWAPYFARYVSNTNRGVSADGLTWYSDPGNRAPTGLVLSSIGARVDDSDAVTAPFSGRLAEVAVWRGLADAAEADAIAAEIIAGKRPSEITAYSADLAMYQPLRTGLNDAGYVGPSWTNNGVTFDAADHPIEYGRVIKVLLQSSGSQ